MLTRDYRPKVFEDIVGQPICVELLRAVIKAPESSPRTMIFRGGFGLGKTSLARIFARALNCKHSKLRPCGNCSVCTQEMDFSPFYQEFDSSDVGSKEAIQGLKDDFFVASQACSWRVVVLDEFHLASRAAQSALLKILEDLPENLFIVFCTTDVEKILPTIRSRAVDLVFRGVALRDLRKNLSRITQAEGLEVPESVIDRICLYSRGHVRDSVMLLDTYATMDSKESFLDSIQSAELDLIKLFVAIKDADKVAVQELVSKVCSTPLDILRQDLYNLIQEALRLYSLGESDSLYKESYKKLVSLYKGELLKLMGFSLSEWAVNSFNSDLTVQAFFWAAFVTFGRSQRQESVVDRYRKKP